MKLYHLLLLVLALSVCIDARATIRQSSLRFKQGVQSFAKDQNFNEVLPQDKRTNLGFVVCRDGLSPVITHGEVCVTGGNLDVIPMLSQIMETSGGNINVKDGHCASLTLGFTSSSQLYLAAWCRYAKQPAQECSVKGNLQHMCAKPCGGTSGKCSIH